VYKSVSRFLKRHPEYRPHTIPPVGPGEYWDSRLWLDPKESDLIFKRRIPKMRIRGIPYRYRNGRWYKKDYWVPPAEVAKCLRIPSTDLLEWMQKRNAINRKRREEGRKERKKSRGHTR